MKYKLAYYPFIDTEIDKVNELLVKYREEGYRFKIFINDFFIFERTWEDYKQWAVYDTVRLTRRRGVKRISSSIVITENANMQGEEFDLSNYRRRSLGALVGVILIVLIYLIMFLKIAYIPRDMQLVCMGFQLLTFVVGLIDLKLLTREDRILPIVLRKIYEIVAYLWTLAFLVEGIFLSTPIYKVFTLIFVSHLFYRYLQMKANIFYIWYGTFVPCFATSLFINMAH